MEVGLKESVINQMKKVIKKEIVPGAVIIFDKDDKYKYIVMDLFIGDEGKINARLKNEHGLMSYPALSERLTVVGFYK
ncbi:hypothetical protein H9660_03645 [Clostridium sp. Sa3CUN1]|uniref:TNase-like domain-containing protein n=1 Tax=Clostridium gallinarum TaxID=2762246 RepID=A0ABR8Q1D6_9CLOT|nr:hypothetical protein [Clostridium gallinarum]MBD7914232.1 hypothetical protein [Clostridium gallinarum]